MSRRSRECAAGGDIRGLVPDVAALIRATGFLAEMKGRVRKKAAGFVTCNRPAAPGESFLLVA
jgi:hypothetical protein